MTAISPYAPLRRNSLLHHPPRRRSSGVGSTLSGVGLLLIVIRYWRNAPALRRLLNRIQEVLPRTLATAFARVVGWMDRCSDRLLLHDTVERNGAARDCAEMNSGPVESRRSGGLLSLMAVSAEASVGFLLVVIRYWRNGPALRRLLQGVHEILPGMLATVFARVVGLMDRCSDLLLSYSTSDGEERHYAEGNSGPVESKNGGESVDVISEAHRIKRNQMQIQSVLKYWFGQYTPEESQKKLWMIAEQSTALRDKVDSEIADRFGSVLLQLSNEELWKEWCRMRDLYGYQGKLAAIIVLDQFSRHIRRYKLVHSIDDAMTFDALREQAELDQMALQAAELLVRHHSDEIKSGMLPVPMYIFALMPYRHANRLETVQYVQQQVEATNDLVQQSDAILRRFRKATNRRMAVLQDQARSTGDVNKNEHTDEDILECFPFEADDSDASQHPVHQTIRSFLADRGIFPKKEGEGAGEAIPIIISLSGGVDSMVIASVLSHLNDSCSYNLELVAVHIDYANRPESAAEAAYVERYCQKLDIQYRCRRIDEVTRGVTARDEYERIAREIRYSLYRDTVQELRRGEGVTVGVVLGHHRGDLRENVLSNAHKGCGPLDLSGMTPVSKNDGVVLYRPLLPLEKTFVYDYAHRYGVPYFKDTTPSWSTRGKLRNKLLPLLEEIYGEGSMNNLSSLAVESDACRELLYGVALEPFLDRVSYKPMGIQFSTTPWKEQGLFFWRFVLRETLHSAGLGMFSDKSVAAFLERVQAPIIKEGWLQCRKDYGVYLQRDGTVFVFYPASFPWRKEDSFSCLGRAVFFGEEKAERVGPWKVLAENMFDGFNDDEAVQYLKTRAISSMEYLMEGSIEYYLEVPARAQNGDEEQSHLVFTKFTKATRPKAWRGVDVKIQEALPLVGNDENSLKTLACQDGQNSRNVAKVTLCLECNPQRQRGHN